MPSHHKSVISITLQCLALVLTHLSSASATRPHRASCQCRELLLLCSLHAAPEPQLCTIRRARRRARSPVLLVLLLSPARCRCRCSSRDALSGARRLRCGRHHQSLEQSDRVPLFPHPSRRFVAARPPLLTSRSVPFRPVPADKRLRLQSNCRALYTLCSLSPSLFSSSLYVHMLIHLHTVGSSRFYCLCLNLSSLSCFYLRFLLFYYFFFV